jgi:MFS family permease
MVVVVTMSYVGVSLPYPILAPIFLSGPLGANLAASISMSPEMALGLVLAAYPAGMFFGNQILGGMADKIGRKPALLTSLVGAAGGYALSAVGLAFENIWLLLVSRLITGVFEGNVPIARALAADLSPRIPKTISFGYIGGAVYAGYLIGPLAGGALTSFTVGAPFEVASALAVVLVIAVAFLLPSTRAESSTSASTSESFSPLLLMKSRKTANLVAVNFLAAISVSAFYQFYPLVLVKDRGYVGMDIALITANLTVALLLSSIFLVKPASDRLGLVLAASIAGICFSAGLCASIWPDSGLLIWIVYFAIGISIPLFTTILSVYTSNQLPADVQGRLMGLLGSAGSLGATAVILVGSYAAQFSSGIPIIFGAALAAMSVAYLLVIAVPKAVEQVST